MHTRLLPVALFIGTFALSATPVLAAPHTVTLSPTADSYIQSGFVNDTYGTQENVFLNLGSNNRSRMFFQFDLSGIPTNATITSSTLALRMTSALSGGTTDTWVNRLDRGWSEATITWDNQPQVAAVSDVTRITRLAEEPKIWDLTSFVQNWMATPSQNYGFSVVSRDSGTNTFTFGFGSRENPDPALRPTLTVTYDATPDTTSAVLSDLQIQNLSLTSANLTFTANESVSATVEYGLTDAYGRTVTSAAAATTHVLNLTPLAPGSTYHYRVRATDATGNETLTTDATFSTPAESGAYPAGTLVKLVDDRNPDTQVDTAVYYVGSDGKRHGFPNSQIYASWYADFSLVQTISATQMATLPLGANVTYRPGVRMVKFQTLPKVYAMDRGGVLRWVATEAVAETLYGPTWNTKIDDLSDAFFTNYTFGADITSPADFNPTSATNGTQTIDQDQGR